MADEYGRSEREESETFSVASIFDEERFWLVVSVLAGSLVVAGYFLNKPYPAYATALFPHMAEVLIENGYRRPEVIPLYTAEGLPFAYPPLMFYVMAVLIDVGIDPLLISRLLPGVAFVLLLVPYFYLSREFLPIRQAGVATVVFATAPQITRWHISGGGAVRSPAVLFLLIGLYVGVRLFKTGDRRWILPGAVLYGLTMLTHPVQMAYFGISYLVLFAAFDRSVRGLLHGAGVALGGAIVGAPWWLYVIRTYGAGTILSASNTHGGLGITELDAVLEAVVLFNDAGFPSEILIASTALAGAVYALTKRRYVLPAWFVVTIITITQVRFAYIPGAMLIGMAVVGAVVPWLAEVVPRRLGRADGETVTTVALAALILSTTWFGALYVTGDPPFEQRNSLGAYVDDDDIEAMEWAARETPPDAQFVVLDNAAEWFPFVADRTSLTVWWGAEWTTQERYERQHALHDDLAACDDAACVNETTEEYDIDPDYVYVDNDRFDDRRSMVEHERYELAYANDGVTVFRVTD
ncbi:hypothetical protein HAPAU_04950 [Halalkalicoccus paucihalophilus]|uniref:Uncharacterized protein n=1 Tax=Halalkalicoccus paucihalophilus TaxID=1008153 RepID=A0A151AJL6_9EURY|nr:glycosyltransferase family 39 protein [Halalkalicoccus paucihalophilus]KYH27823.1 hypothetical protein HAPAU_04950 [Halalkalicoccus paucihalophilus]